MQATKRFSHVAVPADRLISGEDFGKLFGAELLPLGSLEVWAQQSWCVVDVMERTDRLPTEGAALPFIPLRDDIPDQAVGGISLDLLQAFLAAVLTLGPAGTVFETKRGLGEKCPNGGFAGGDVDRFRFVRFGAGD